MNLHRVSSVVLSAVAALSLAASAQAAIVVTNPGFEAQVLADGVDSWPAGPTGWLVLGSGISGEVCYKNPLLTDSPQAVNSNFGYAYASNANSALTLYQEVDTAFVANTTYTLRVLVGDIDATARPFPDTVRLGIYNGTANSGGVLTDVLPGGITNITTTPGDGQAAYYTVNYTTGAVAPTGPVVIGMSVFNTTQDGALALATFDDVTVTVPEPATLGVLVGAASLLGLRRRRGQ